MRKVAVATKGRLVKKASDIPGLFSEVCQHTTICIYAGLVLVAAMAIGLIPSNWSAETHKALLWVIVPAVGPWVWAGLIWLAKATDDCMGQAPEEVR